MDNQKKLLQETDRKASFAMIRFVLIILVVALLIAAAWFFLFTPGDLSAVVS